MLGSDKLLVAIEECRRKGFWAQTWQRYKLSPSEMLQEGVRLGLTSESKDFPQGAGDHLFGLGMEPGLISEQHDVHSEVVHLSAIAEITTAVLRKPGEAPWRIPDPLGHWTPSCFLAPNGGHLRRIVFVSSWNEERHYSLCRSWETLGNVCQYGLPMKMVAIVLGAHRDGRYHGFFSKAVRHPASKKLRFRKRSTFGGGFKETWNPIWREDHDDISTKEWVEVMMEDGVLEDSCFVVTIEVPEKPQQVKIRDLAAKRLEQLEKTREIPDPSLSVCDWPVPCVFRGPCHKNDVPSSKYGFVRLDEISELQSDRTSDHSPILQALRRKPIP